MLHNLFCFFFFFFKKAPLSLFPYGTPFLLAFLTTDSSVQTRREEEEEEEG